MPMRHTLLLVAIIFALSVPAFAASRASQPTPQPQPVPAVSVTTLPALPTVAPIATPSPGPMVLPAPASALPAPPGELIQLLGTAVNPRLFTLKDLQSMRRSSVTVRILDADGRRRAHTYTGVLLRDLINANQAPGSTMAFAALRKYVIVTGISGTSAIVAFAEFEPDFSGKQVLVAYLIDSQPLPTPGIAQLVVPEDATTARFIAGITKIEVASAGSS